MALLVHFTNQGLGEFLIQVPQTALGGCRDARTEVFDQAIQFENNNNTRR